jgi:citronellyl-CoA dehydrogenase
MVSARKKFRCTISAEESRHVESLQRRARALPKTVRQFAEREIAPYADDWEKAKDFPSEIFKKAGEIGLFGAHYPEAHGGAGGDYWFSVAKAQELPRGRCAGVTMALLVQSDMATPVISDLGTPQQIDEFLKPALAGERIASIGVSEPSAGSDVAGIRTTARRDGGDYVLNVKRPSSPTAHGQASSRCSPRPTPTPAHGCTFFLVPTDTKGFRVGRRLDKIGNHASDTAELFLEDVRIPASYRLGEENMGFMYLMQNFQSERLIGAVSGLAGARLAVEFSRKYGEERVAFEADHQARRSGSTASSTCTPSSRWPTPWSTARSIATTTSAMSPRKTSRSTL